MKEFEINFSNPPSGTEKTLIIRHQTETFDFEFEGISAAIINNGDNSWSIG